MISLLQAQCHKFQQQPPLNPEAQEAGAFPLTQQQQQQQLQASSSITCGVGGCKKRFRSEAARAQHHAQKHAEVPLLPPTQQQQQQQLLPPNGPQPMLSPHSTLPAKHSLLADTPGCDPTAGVAAQLPTRTSGGAIPLYAGWDDSPC